jgi:hypothetical protein
VGFPAVASSILESWFSNMTSKRTVSRITLFVLLAAFLFYPFETTVVPEWKIQVVDESGNPVKGVVVNQGWRHHSVEIRRQEHSLVVVNTILPGWMKRTP